MDNEQTEFKPEITAVQVQVNRSAQGLNIRVRTNPKIEDFFRNISAGEVENFDLRVNGRYWNLKNGENNLPLYAIQHEPAMQGQLPIGQMNFQSYILSAPGRRIIEADGKTGQNVVNLSFLRTAGVSKDGVEISVRGVYSDPQVRQIHDGILTGVNAFCDAFLRPISLTINLIES